MSDELARLAYEASLRRLDKQEESLTQMRSRTGLLLAASSLAASFFGPPALEANSLLLALALAAFAITIGASLAVLVPMPELRFALVGSSVYERLYDLRDDVGAVHLRLAHECDRMWDLNDPSLRRLLWSFRVAAFALGIQVVLLLAAVGGNLG
jgi:hypothetical protein